MARSAIFAAIALALIESPAAAAAASSASTVPSAIRAGPPRYVQGGWVCPPGYVWRNAGRTDWLCVDPAEARRIQQENRDAAAKRDGPRGADGCRLGLVRREAFKSDIVCVDPVRRELVREMNLALFDRR